MAGRVWVEREGPIATILFSNPPSGYMDPGTEEGLKAALDDVEGAPSVHVIIVTGAEKGVFIRHYDVGLLEERGRKLAARGLTFTTDRAVPEPPLHACFRRIEDSAKPYICALNGTAMGGGFELALACDLRLAQDGPFDLGLPEVNVGLLPGAGGTQRLPALIGLARAMELMLLGRTVSPREAYELGLVTACVPDVRQEARRLALELASKPPRAVAHIKRLARQSLVGDRTKGLADERTLFCDLMVSPPTVERMAAMNRGERDIRDRD